MRDDCTSWCKKQDGYGHGIFITYIQFPVWDLGFFISQEDVGEGHHEIGAKWGKTLLLFYKKKKKKYNNIAQP